MVRKETGGSGQLEEVNKTSLATREVENTPMEGTEDRGKQS